MMREKYESLPLGTLKELAKARGLKGISTMKKAELIELMLKEDEKEKNYDYPCGDSCGCYRSNRGNIAIVKLVYPLL